MMLDMGGAEAVLPRINIEDRIYKDKRFFDLALKLGSKRMALGALIEAWSLAQEYFLNDDTKGLIPKEVWDKQEIETFIIEVGLAIEKGKGVYMCGASEEFKWLKTCQESGRNWGKGHPKGTLGYPKVPKGQLTSSSSSSSFSKEEDIYSSFDFEIIYDAFPRKQGKTRGIKKCEVAIKDQQHFDDLLKAVRNYGTYCASNNLDTKFIKLFSTFMGEWVDWVDPITESALDDLAELREKYGGDDEI